MAGSAFGLHIRQLILGDIITSNELDTLLADGNYQAGFLNLLDTPSSLNMILRRDHTLDILFGSTLASQWLFDTDEAIDIISDSDLATYKIVTNSLYLSNLTASQKAISIYNSSISKKTRIEQYVNNPISKLRRSVINANGTFTYSDTPIKMSVLAIGSGANGGSNNSNVNSSIGPGGGGGEIVQVTYTSSIPASGQAIVIGNEVNTTFGSLITADSALNASGSSGSRKNSAGAGATSGDSLDLYLNGVINPDIDNSWWNYGNYTLKGGNGEGSIGAVDGNTVPISDASIPHIKWGGSIGEKSSANGDGSDAGLGISVGGREGVSDSYTEAGRAATYYGAGGGGASFNYTVSGASGGVGKTGVVAVTYIIN